MAQNSKVIYWWFCSKIKISRKPVNGMKETFSWSCYWLAVI